MANIIPAVLRVNPAFVMPELLLQYQQASGAFESLASGDPMVRLGEGDLAVYVKRMDVRTQVQQGQFASNQLPSCSVEYHEISTPTYLLRTRAEYDHHDTAAFGRTDTSIVEAQRLAMRQGIFQQMRNILLYGANPANGEGLLNTVGATSVTLPADSNGHTTVATYDPGQLALFLLQQIGSAKVRTMQIGMGSRVVVLTTQRVMESISYAGIVQMTQFQRAGAGTSSVRGMITNVLEWNEDEIDWAVDDTLIGKGAGGTDPIIVTIPEVKRPDGGGINTNEFAKLAPGLEACNLMLVDMAAPREITSPLAGGAVDVVSELRATPGWSIRPTATTILSVQYQ